MTLWRPVRPTAIVIWILLHPYIANFLQFIFTLSENKVHDLNEVKTYLEYLKIRRWYSFSKQWLCFSCHILLFLASNGKTLYRIYQGKNDHDISGNWGTFSMFISVSILYSTWSFFDPYFYHIECYTTSINLHPFPYTTYTDMAFR